MKKMIIAALVLLLAQIGLSVALNLSNKGIEAGAPDTLFLTVFPEQVESLEFTDAKGSSLTLQKEQKGWVMPTHFSAPADESKVSELLDRLAGMKQGFVVATSPDAAKRFKVASDSFEHHVVVQGGGEVMADFYVGTSPAFRQVHARREGSDQIVAISLSGFELENDADKWLDKSAATLKDSNLVSLTLGEIKLEKSDSGWQLADLKEGEQVNKSEVEALVTKARSLTIRDVADPALVADLFTEPQFKFTAVKTGGDEVEYLFAKTKDDSYVLKLSDSDLYFKVADILVEALKDKRREDLLMAGEKAVSEQQ